MPPLGSIAPPFSTNISRARRSFLFSLTASVVVGEYVTYQLVNPSTSNVDVVFTRLRAVGDFNAWIISPPNTVGFVQRSPGTIPSGKNPGTTLAGQKLQIFSDTMLTVWSVSLLQDLGNWDSGSEWEGEKDPIVLTPNTALILQRDVVSSGLRAQVEWEELRRP